MIRRPDRTVIRIGARHAPFAAPAIHLDGRTAAAADVRLALDRDNDTLTFTRDGTDIDWPLGEIRRQPDQSGDAMVLSLAGDPVQRLIVDDPGLRHQVAAACPNLARRPRRRGLRALTLWAAGAIAAIALILTVLVPQLADRLAAFLPPTGERALGEATLGQIRRGLGPGETALPLCETPDGRAALDTLAATLTADVNLPHPLTLQVVRYGQVNAFALPGGYVTLFSGLIDAAETPDEVAAVIAHEIGHVAARDPTRIALRSAGSIGVLGLVFGDFAGGAAVLFLVERLIQASYSQEAEAAADAYASARLTDAGIDPGALGDFFERLRKRGEPPALVQHILPHPELAARIEAARDAPVPDGTRPALTDDEWRALQDICG